MSGAQPPRSRLVRPRLREAALTAAAGGALLLFCASLLATDPGYFWSDDYQTANLPGLLDCARAWRQGELPLLSSSCWRCGALAADYPYGAFAPLPTLCVLGASDLGLTLPLTAALVSSVHLAVLAAGAFRLGRRRGLSVDVALLVAWVAALNGFVFFWGGRIWIPCLVSFAWLPWLWWALERSREERNGWARFVLPGIFLGLILTAGWHFTVVMAGIVSAWLTLRTWAQRRRLTAVWPTIAGWGAGLGLSAPAWLMFLEYLPSTTRGQGQQLWLSVSWTVSLDSLPGLVFPHASSAWVFEHWKPHLPLELFGGLVPLVIVVAALCRRGAACFRSLRWECGLCLFLLFVVTVPSFGNFLYSFRWLPLFFLALALVGGETLALLRQPTPAREAPNLGLWCVGLVLVVWCHALLTAPAPTLLLLSGVALGFFSVSFVWLRADGRFAATSALRRAMPCVVVLVSSWFTYATCTPFSEVPTWEMGEQMRRPEPLDPNVRYASLYAREDMFEGDPQRLVRPWKGTGAGLYVGNTAMYSGLDFINGYSPTRPAGMEEVLPFRAHGYATPEGAAHLLEVDTRRHGLLELLGVDGLVVSDRFAEHKPALLANGWREVARVEGGTVFRRDGPPSPRVRAVDRAEIGAERADVLQQLGSQTDGPAPVLLTGNSDSRGSQTLQFAPAAVNVVSETRNGVTVDVAATGEGEALVVFSRPWFPGYRATWNGQPVAVEVADLILPAVRVPAGAPGKLVLEYRPRSLIIGSWLAAVTGALVVGTLALAAVQRLPRRKAHQTEPAPRHVGAGDRALQNIGGGS